MITINTEEIKKKNAIIDNAIIKLKEKFVGVDDQIDEIMNNVRTWYCYPQLQDRPCVINLWGMSGCSKTDSVRTIAKLLDIEEDLVYFNFADINEKNAWEIENEIDENIGNNKSNRILVYDEFQYAATLTKKGEEKDNKTALKPFWELLDTGVLLKRLSPGTLFTLLKAYLVLKRISEYDCKIDIKEGKWLNHEECFRFLNENEKRKVMDIFEVCPYDETENSRPQKKKIFHFDDTKSTTDKLPNDGTLLRVKEWIIDKIIEIYNSINGLTYLTDDIEIETKIRNMNGEELTEFFYNTYKVAKKGYKLNFKDSLIFVIGNLDEAYNISFDMNPDMSPDQFHKMTKKITVVDIKEALQERFRNEQIARLGNIHVIYPAFSSKTFKGIIDKQLKQYAEQVKTQIGCDVVFEKSIKDIIYREGVFPTQGTRPIFSSLFEIVKSRLPEIVKSLTENGNISKLNHMVYAYRRGHIKVTSYDNDDNLIDSIKFKLKLRVDNLRLSKCDEQQTICAVHESGHFVTYMKVFGKYPNKIVSRTTGTNTGGFLIGDIDNDERFMKTYDYYFKRIMIYLGGYVAEKVVFGRDNRTSGSTSDISEATRIASQMVKNLGLYYPYALQTFQCDEYKDFVHLDKNEEINNLVIGIMKSAIKCVTEIYEDKDYRKMLKFSSEYLSRNTEMSRQKMKEIYSIIPDSKKTVIKDDFYRNALSNFK